MSASDADGGLRRGPMLLIGAIGILAFIAMLVLGVMPPTFAADAMAARMVYPPRRPVSPVSSASPPIRAPSPSGPQQAAVRV